MWDGDFNCFAISLSEVITVDIFILMNANTLETRNYCMEYICFSDFANFVVTIFKNGSLLQAFMYVSIWSIGELELANYQLSMTLLQYWRYMKHGPDDDV